MIQEIKPEKLVLAHMGGWGQWNDVSSILEEDYMKNVYLDTSSCIKKLNHNASLPIEKFKKMVNLIYNSIRKFCGYNLKIFYSLFFRQRTYSPNINQAGCPT